MALCYCQLINPVLALKKTCVRPQTGEPYIKSIRAGKNTVQVRFWTHIARIYVVLSSLTLLLSSVAQGEQITHAIVFEFENLEDLTYYADTDPVSK
jgi:hypothetical protein